METPRIVADAVLLLDEPMRSIILKRYYRGWSSAKIAKDMPIPASTVRSHLKTNLHRPELWNEIGRGQVSPDKTAEIDYPK